MDIRHNGHFYRNSAKAASIQPTPAEAAIDLESSITRPTSNKILVCAYKDLMQHFNQLENRSKNKWQLEINVIARQLAQLFKQTAKIATYNGYPALNLLKEIRQLDEKITGARKDALEALS